MGVFCFRHFCIVFFFVYFVFRWKHLTVKWLKRNYGNESLTKRSNFVRQIRGLYKDYIGLEHGKLLLETLLFRII